jgi:acyl-CoA thioesterase-2
MWFHRPVKADGWLFYDIDSPIAHGGRGLARGQMFDLAGKLQISVTQEGLTRQIR